MFLRCANGFEARGRVELLVEPLDHTQGAVAEGKERAQGRATVRQHMTDRAANSATQTVAPGAAQHTASGRAGRIRENKPAAHELG